MKILLSINTCAANYSRRLIVANTCLQLPECPPHIWLYGQDTPDWLLTDHTLYLPSVSDLYDNLVYKTAEWLERVLDIPGWTHTFRCDDDTFFLPHRLPSLAEADYVGGVEDGWCDQGTGRVFASGGAGYLLSRSAIERLIPFYQRTLNNRLVQYETSWDDVLIARAAYAAQIPLVQDKRLIPYGNDSLRPLTVNGVITSHKLPLPLWMDTYHRWQSIC